MPVPPVMNFHKTHIDDLLIIFCASVMIICIMLHASTSVAHAAAGSSGGSTAAQGDQSTGTLTGTVCDAAGKKLSEAGVNITPADATAGTSEQFVLTNSEGFFAAKLPRGTYTITITYPNCETKVIRDIAVAPGKPKHIRAELSPQLVQIDEMRVVAKPKGDVELVQLMKRRVASNILDNISAETISKIPESDVAGILTRMPGITIAEGKFLQARGMPKRYNRTQFNGSTLPTTKPNEKLVPLNLFPAGVVESLNVAKSYSPDLPGNFSGGLCQIQTKSIPDSPFCKLKTTLEYNTATTNRDFLTYHGGGRDWLGYDDETRDKPGIIPDDKLVRRGRFTKDGYSPSELERFGEAMSDTWEPYVENADWNHDFGLVFGDRIGRFGYTFNAGYKNESQIRENEKNNIYSAQGGQGELKLDNYYTFDRATRKIRVNGMLNCGFELTPDHKFYISNFYIHTGEDEVTHYEGYNSDIGGEIKDSRLRWVEEEIYSGQIRGEHYFYGLFEQKLDWEYTYSMATMWEPDLRETEYEYNPPTGNFNFANESMSGFHMWTRQEEDIHDLKMNWRVAFDQWSGLETTIKTGAGYLERDREFWSRRFRFMPLDTSRIDISDPVEDILVDENINPYEFEIQETTRTTDQYDADQKVWAWYCMMDLPIFSWLSVSGGVRFEDSDINLVSFNLFDPSDKITSDIETEDWFPALNLTFKITDNINIRMGYSETVSRPEFHELAPFEFTDVRGGRAVKGNPDLEVSEIKNYDFRFEWFINDLDLLAVSVFYKDFTNAIEKTIQPTIELRRSYINADDAWLWGVELELRKNLGFLSRYLQHWNITGNYIYSDSESEIEPSPGFVPTSLKREMVGQAEHVYNITLEYENPDWQFTGRLMFQHTSDRISEIGGLGLPDIILEDSSKLDIVFIKKLWEHFEVKLIGENITNEGTSYTQGGRVFHRWREGVTWKFKLAYTW